MTNPFVRREKTLKERKRIKRIKMIILIIILITLFIIGCAISQYNQLRLIDLIKALFNQGDKQHRVILFDIRLPRLCLAILTGLCMGASGVIMQNLLRNDLASPGTLGVADGATLFVTIYMAFLAQDAKTNPLLMPILALIGGLLAALIIGLLGVKRKKMVSPTRLIMTGVAVSAMYSAISTIVTYALDETKLHQLQSWQAGELWAASTSRPWLYIGILSIWFICFGGYALFKGRVLNAINLGYDTATGLGINTKKEFILLGFCAIALSSGAVAFGGNFFFLGLIGPHIARRIVGHDARYLIPTSGIVAGIMVIFANILVTDFDICANIPTGIFVSIVSVPYFIYLLLKSR